MSRVKKHSRIIRSRAPVSVLVLCLAVAGCASYELPAERDARFRRQQQMAVMPSRYGQTATRQGRELAAVRADVQRVVEDCRKLNARSQDNATQLENIQHRLDLIERELARLDSTYRNKLEQLQQAVKLEGAARQKAIRTVVRSVSQEISATANKLQAQQQRMLKAMADDAGGAQGEYKVVRGDTLGAIAAAFGVTVDEIKKANQLKNDLIREGQKLVIPKKHGR